MSNTFVLGIHTLTGRNVELCFDFVPMVSDVIERWIKDNGNDRRYAKFIVPFLGQPVKMMEEGHSLQDYGIVNGEILFHVMTGCFGHGPPDLYEDEESFPNARLVRAVQSNNMEEARIHLRFVNEMGAYSRTALHYVHSVEMLQLLLEGDVNVNVADAFGKTLLHYGCSSSWKNGGKLVPALLKVGANPNALDQWGRTALHSAATGVKYGENQETTKQVIHALLAADPSLVDVEDGGERNALHLALHTGHLDAARLLWKGGLPLQLDVSRCDVETVRWLRAMGVRWEYYNATYKKGRQSKENWEKGKRIMNLLFPKTPSLVWLCGRVCVQKGLDLSSLPSSVALLVDGWCMEG